MSQLCALAAVSGVTWYLEHRAIPVQDGDVEAASNRYTGIGWQLCKEKREGDRMVAAFMQNIAEPYIRIELVGPDIPAHEGFRVSTVEGLTQIVDNLKSNTDLQHLEDMSVNDMNTRAEMFRDQGSQAVFQLVWRHPESVFFEDDKE
jgi:hypothetical protein